MTHTAPGSPEGGPTLAAEGGAPSPADDRIAARLRGFGPLGILAILVILALGIAFKFLMKTIVMPLLGADPVNHAYHYLAGNRAALLGAVWAMIVVAGFGEETVFRGYMFERFGKLLFRTRRVGQDSDRAAHVGMVRTGVLL